MSKDLIIYHSNCDDGFGSAFAHWFWTGRLPYEYLDQLLVDDVVTVPVIKTNSAYYYEGYYNKPFPFDLLTSEIARVFILDFSYDIEVLREITSKVQRVVLIDHHKKCIDSLSPYLELNSGKPNNLDIILHSDYSGAQLSWTYFSGYTTAVAPQLIAHIGDNDLWKFQINETREFTEALRSYPRSFDEWFDIYMRTDRELGGYEKFIKEGIAILKYKNNIIADLILFGKQAITLNDELGLVCNAPKIFSSDIGTILAEESCTFGMTWCLDREELVICSLRSIGDYDVNELAKTFGGGGHKNSAGFTLNSLSDLQDILTTSFFLE